jgi:hypothetical protein
MTLHKSKKVWSSLIRIYVWCWCQMFVLLMGCRRHYATCRISTTLGDDESCCQLLCIAVWLFYWLAPALCPSFLPAASVRPCCKTNCCSQGTKYDTNLALCVPLAAPCPLAPIPSDSTSAPMLVVTDPTTAPAQVTGCKPTIGPCVGTYADRAWASHQ